MSMANVGRLFVLCLLLLGAAMAWPGSPIYLTKLLTPSASYNGRSPTSWSRDLGSPDASTRSKAVFALGCLGKDSYPHLPALAKILAEDPEGAVRSQTALAMTKLAPGTKVAVPELTKALEDNDFFVRMNATLALGLLKKDARSAAPALTKLMKDPASKTNLDKFHHTIQHIAAMSLGNVTTGSADALPDLLALLAEADSSGTYIAVCNAMVNIGPAAAPAVPKLRELLKNNSKGVQEAASEAIEAVEGKAPAIEPKNAPAVKKASLPESERKYLWDIEHHGNILVKHGFSRLSAALKSGDPNQLAVLFADDFTGHSRMGNVTLVKSSKVEVSRTEPTSNAGSMLDRKAFVEKLQQARAIFAVAPPGVGVSLKNLGPKVRGKIDGPWQGTMQVRIYGESEPGAPAEVTLQIAYDLREKPTETTLEKGGWLASATLIQTAIAKSPTRLFMEVAHQRGIDASKLHDNWIMGPLTPNPGGVYVSDFNNDGWLDFVVIDPKGPTLYQGEADGQFRDVTARVGLPLRPLGSNAVAWIDVDGDGFDDLILDRRFFRNQSGKGFVDVTEKCNLRLPRDCGSFVVADYDRDGKLDFYVTRSGAPGGASWLDAHTKDASGNFLFRNLGGWQLEDVTKKANALGGYRSTFAAAWLDANNDGWPDLHVINEFGDGVLLVSNGRGAFSEQPLAERPADFGSMGVAAGDINNDGNIDIYCANMFSKAGSRVIANLATDAYPPNVMEKFRRFVAGSQLHLNRGGLAFDQAAIKMQIAAVGWAYGPALADLDNDGWLDIYATAGFVSRNREDPDG